MVRSASTRAQRRKRGSMHYVIYAAMVAMAGGLSDQIVDLRPGDKVPGFSLAATDGKTFSLSDFKGQALAITWFSASLSHRGSGTLVQERLCSSLRDAAPYLHPCNAAAVMISVNTPLQTAPFMKHS